MDQGLLAIAAALPETPLEELADWPLGRRNSTLAALHSSSFGPRLQGWLSCGQCGEKLEFELDARSVAKQRDLEPISAEPIVIGKHTFRLPTSRDVASVALEKDSLLAAVHLLESCWLGTGEPPTWSEGDIEEVGERMAAADPMAETRIMLKCPACGNKCDRTLDFPSFLWGEIEASARRLLAEIHILSSAYGWTEREILSLSEPRRFLYVEMVRA